jgi:proteic killer suppression protein
MTIIFILDKRNQFGYNMDMIKSFKHKGLEQFFKTGSLKGIQPMHQSRLLFILQYLNEAGTIKDLDVSSFKLHQLKGDLKGLWAITVQANWRITFKFEDENVYIVVIKITTKRSKIWKCTTRRTQDKC